MHSMLLTSDKDPMGAAIIDYLAHGKASKLRVFSSMFDEDEIPVNQLFRTFQEMPSLEQKALQLSTCLLYTSGPNLPGRNSRAVCLIRDE